MLLFADILLSRRGGVQNQERPRVVSGKYAAGKTCFCKRYSGLVLKSGVAGI